MTVLSGHLWFLLWTKACLSKKSIFFLPWCCKASSSAVHPGKEIKVGVATSVYAHWRWSHIVNSLICPVGTKQYVIYGTEPVLCLNHGQHFRLFQSKVLFHTNRRNTYTGRSAQKLEEQWWKTKIKTLKFPEEKDKFYLSVTVYLHIHKSTILSLQTTKTLVCQRHRLWRTRHKFTRPTGTPRGDFWDAQLSLLQV